MYGRPYPRRPMRRRPRRRKKWVHPLVKAQRARVSAAKSRHRKALRAAGLLPPAKPRRRRGGGRRGARRVVLRARDVMRSRAAYDFGPMMSSGMSLYVPPSMPPMPRPKRAKAPAVRVGGRSYPFIPIRSIEKLVKLAGSWGVASVARSPRGFVAAFKRAAGKSSKLSPAWKAKRNAFIRRHLAEAKKNGEKLSLKKGKITRRSLALAMWGYKSRG